MSGKKVKSDYMNIYPKNHLGSFHVLLIYSFKPQWT